MDLACGDTAKSEPGGELSAEIEAEHAVAGIFVGGHIATSDKMFDSSMAGAFASMKRMGRLSVRWPFRCV